MTALIRRAGVLQFAGFVIAALVFLGWLYREHESSLNPVVVDFQITWAKVKDDSLYISGLMRKRRDCEFLDVVAYSGRRFVSVEFLESERIVTRRPRLQTFGPWKLTPRADRVQLFATHRCLTGLVVTELYNDVVTP